MEGRDKDLAARGVLCLASTSRHTLLATSTRRSGAGRAGGRKHTPRRTTTPTSSPVSGNTKRAEAVTSLVASPSTMTVSILKRLRMSPAMMRWAVALGLGLGGGREFAG